MKKQFIGKHRKHFITLTCLVAGMLVLTSAVYANYDNAGGYSNYKNALKNLVFEADNFTADAEMKLIIDGKEVNTSKLAYKCNDGEKNMYTQNEENFDGEPVETEIYVYEKGNMSYTYYPKTNKYYERESNTESKKTIVPLDDVTSKKAVRFAELMADTFVGDLKNNVTLVSEEDGVRKYSIHVEKSQIPEIVNAGLSLMFSANNNSTNDASYVTYDNYEKAFAVYYKERTGKEYSQLDYEALSDSEIKARNDYYSDYYDDFQEKYEDILDEKGNTGMLVVLNDGDYAYYDTYEEYRQSENISSELQTMAMFGDDPYIDDVTMNVTLDAKGRLVENYLDASLVGKDKNGEKHTATMKIESKLYDYDNTIVEKFETEGKVKMY